MRQEKKTTKNFNWVSLKTRQNSTFQLSYNAINFKSCQQYIKECILHVEPRQETLWSRIAIDSQGSGHQPLTSKSCEGHAYFYQSYVFTQENLTLLTEILMQKFLRRIWTEQYVPARPYVWTARCSMVEIASVVKPHDNFSLVLSRGKKIRRGLRNIFPFPSKTYQGYVLYLVAK